MLVLVGLDLSQDQVADLERTRLNSAPVVATQSLLVLGRSEQGDVPCLVELVDCVLSRLLRLGLVVRPGSRRAVL